MENASKALLIAGAILIAIVLISLGVMILGQGSDLVKNNNMSEVEITAYNNQFEQYIGPSVRGNVVNQLVAKVNQHNATNKDDKSKTVTITTAAIDNNTATTVFNPEKAGGTTYQTKYQSGQSYKVVAQKSSGGLITRIYINQIK